LAGIVGFLVDASLLYLLKNELGLYVGRIFSFCASAITTWSINRYFTFINRRSTQSPCKEFLTYFFFMLIGGLVNYLVYIILIISYETAKQIPIIAVALGCIAGMAINFFTSKYLIFK